MSDVTANVGHVKDVEGLEAVKKRKKDADLKDDLIKFYRWRHYKVQLSPLFEENDTPLATFYVRPDIEEKMKGTKDEKRKVTSLSDLFNSESKYNREIYLTANAGLGKTTFSKYLATSWCQAHCLEEKNRTSFEKDDIDSMHDFEFVFLVLLRDSYNLCSIDDFIFNLIISTLYHSVRFEKDFLSEILNREKCLVILDGLDEWTHPENPEKPCYRTPRSIPHRNDRERCTVLTTTRPWKLGVLNLRSYELGKQVELTKLSKDSALTLTTRTIQRIKSLPDEESSKNEAETLIANIDADLAFVPLLLMYIICLYCDGVKIGNSKCELYVNIVELLLSRTADKLGEFQSACDPLPGFIPECFTEHDYCTKYFTLLMKLGKLAYHTLFNEKRENTLVFDRKVAENYLKADMGFSLHSGILTGSTTRTLTKEISKVSFSHKTVQEFFAAIFISSQDDAQKTVLEKCKTVENLLDNIISSVCQFVSGMNSLRMCKISERQDLFINDESDQYLKHLSKVNRNNLKSLYIYISARTVSLCETIDTFSLIDLNSLQKVYYEGDWNVAGTKLLSSPCLQSLSLIGKKTNFEENLNNSLIEKMQRLEYLYIRDFKFSHVMLKTFVNLISSKNTLKEIMLSRLFCEEHHLGCERMKLDFSKHSHLTKVALELLPPLELDITTPSLVHVCLSNMNLGEKSVLLSPKMLKIKHIDLKYIKMSTLQDNLKILNKLQQTVTVNVEDCHIKKFNSVFRNYSSDTERHETIVEFCSQSSKEI